jgi:hypothetical protein
MTLSSTPPRVTAQSGRQSLVRAQLLIEEALQHLDDYANAPELGARLDEILARLRERLERLDSPVEQMGANPSKVIVDGQGTRLLPGPRNDAFN